MSDQPEKETEGKPAFDILFNTPVKEVAEIFTLGEEKYPREADGLLNWRKAMLLPAKERRQYVEKLMGAALRHIEREFQAYDDQVRGKVDEESGKRHLAHACANLLMALDILD